MQNKKFLHKRFLKLRDQRDEVLNSDLTPNERYRKSQAIQRQINAVAKKYREAKN